MHPAISPRKFRRGVAMDRFQWQCLVHTARGPGGGLGPLRRPSQPVDRAVVEAPAVGGANMFAFEGGWPLLFDGRRVCQISRDARWHSDPRSRKACV